MKAPFRSTGFAFSSALLLTLFWGADARADEGARLYTENCAACHGAKGEGQANWKTPNDDGSLRARPMT